MVMTNLIMAPKGGYLEKSEVARRLPAIMTREKHPSRSDKYLTVVTEDAIDGLHDLGYRIVEAQVSKTRNPDLSMSVKHLIWLVHEQYLRQRVVGDEWPRLGVLNSFAGQSAWEVMLGFWVLKCLNGLVAPTGKMETLKFAHKTTNTLEEIIGATYTVAQEAEQRMAQVSQWKQIRLDRPEQELYARHAAHVRFGDAAVVEGTLAYNVQEILRPRQGEGNSLWDTFNRSEQNLHNGFVHNQVSGRKAKAVNGLSGKTGKIEFERGLWNLTEEFAALKTGAAVV